MFWFLLGVGALAAGTGLLAGAGVAYYYYNRPYYYPYAAGYSYPYYGYGVPAFYRAYW